MRKLKFHEQKLLRKVDFLQWKNEHNLREVQAMRRYHIQDRDDYKKYNKLCGMATRMVRLGVCHHLGCPLPSCEPGRPL